MKIQVIEVDKSYGKIQYSIKKYIYYIYLNVET